MQENFSEYLSDFFSKLPDEKTREYEKQIAKLASGCTTPEKLKALREMADGDSSYAFEAFYCLCTVYRRNRDYELMRELISSHSRFSDRISFNHIVIQYQVHSESLFDYDELLQSAYDDAEKMSDNAGFLQSFCNAFATICENCNEEDLPGIIDRWYKDALRLINRAIRLDQKYAKFYWTKARIVSFKGEFDEANHLIAQAISYEDSSRPDYFLTILNYQHSKTRFAMQQQRAKLEGRISELENRVKELTSELGQLSGGGSADENETEAPSIYDGDEPYIFVSYAHKDKQAVYDIIARLQKKGARIWYDKGIRAGDDWPDEIGKHLIASSAVVVMLSANSINSKYVRREINVADDSSMKIIPVLLDDSKLPTGVKLQLGLSQMLQRTRYSIRTFIEKLFNVIDSEIGG